MERMVPETQTELRVQKAAKEPKVVPTLETLAVRVNPLVLNLMVR